MIGLGCGEIIGSLVFGRVADKCSNNTIVLINLVAMTVGYAFLILYAAIYDFSYYLAVLMTFFWGVQDAGISCYMNVLLGF
jgi:predicted MFS family arabinose efflux permease